MSAFSLFNCVDRPFAFGQWALTRCRGGLGALPKRTVLAVLALWPGLFGGLFAPLYAQSTEIDVVMPTLLSDGGLLDEPIELPEMLGGGEIGGELVFAADSLDFNIERHIVQLRGAVEIYGESFAILADELYLDIENLSGEARGNVLVRVGDSTMAVDRFVLDQATALSLASNIRLVLDGFATASARRMIADPNGRTLLDYTSYTPCQNCIDSSLEPLWHIEARRAELNNETQQLYFYNATLHFFGVPVLPVPFIQVPAPGAERLSGWLRPSIGQQTGADFELGLPYFFAFDESLDLTLEPKLHFGGAVPIGAEMRAEYRQAIANGAINADLTAGYQRASGALNSGEGKLDGEIHLFGEIGLNRNFVLNWDWTEATDEDFDEDFLDHSATAWTENRVQLEGFSRRNYVSAAIVDQRPANASLDPSDLTPDYFPVVEAEFVSEPDGLGLVYRSLADFRYLDRASGAREYARIATDNRLEVPIHLGWGIMNHTTLGTRADGYYIQFNDLSADVLVPTSTSVFTGNRFRAVPFAQTKLEVPIVLTSEDSISVINPMLALTWANNDGGMLEIPNEDGRAAELDAGNLMAINRSEGWDWVERGVRLDAAISLRSVTSFPGSVFDATKPSSLVVDGFIGMGLKHDWLDRYDANSGLEGHMTELIADIDVNLTHFGSVDIDTRWDLETSELTRGLASSKLTLFDDYVLTLSAERQVWQTQGTWDEQFSATTTGPIPFTDRQQYSLGYTLTRNSGGGDTQWASIGVDGELGAGEFLYPWKYDLEYKRRVDGTYGEEVLADFGYACDCADFFINSRFFASTPGEWDAEVSFLFDFATLLEDVEITDVQSWFGY